MSTLSNKEILEVDFFSEYSACQPVHTFCKYFKGYKKERKHGTERQLLVHMSTLCNDKIIGVDFFSEFSDLVHLSTLFAKN